MEKQSPSFHKRWQKRYFVLCKRVLKYYKGKTDYRNDLPPKGVINFEQVWVEDEYFDDSNKINLKIKDAQEYFD